MSVERRIRIPFNRPFLTGREFDYMARASESGHLSGDGPFSRKCQSLLESAIGAPKVLLTPSATAALEMAAILCRITGGDEIILPTFTFVSTANAFHLRGARLVFTDIHPGTLNMDETALPGLIGERTKAIVPVHYAGVGCAMDAVESVARPMGLRVVEDAAQAVDAFYRDRALGSFGDLAVLSFHETKNIHCGEGGALIINDPALIERAEIIREKGTDRSRFFRGEVDKYTWIDIGSSFLPSELSAAFLLAQIESLKDVTGCRLAIWNRYRRELAPLEEAGILRLPVVPEGCRANGHLFHVLAEDARTRDRLLLHLKGQGILAVFHYLPLHQSPVGRSLGYRDGQFPVAESAAARLARLPLYAGMNEGDQGDVIQAVRAFFGR